MRSLRILLADLALVSFALVASSVLRENLEFSSDHLVALIPYGLLTIAAAAIVLPLSGVTRAVWRYSSPQNYRDIVTAVVAIVAGASVLTFVANRLDGVSRALPLLQALITITLMIGARIASRLWHARRSPGDWQQDVIVPTAESVLLVGLNELAELYLHCITRYARDRVRVVGLLDAQAPRGQSLLSHRVLGTPEQVADVVRTLEVHGVVITRIVLAVPLRELSVQAREALFALEAANAIPLEFLDQKIASERPNREAPRSGKAPETRAQTYAFSAMSGEGLASSPYRTIKRSLDIFLAALLLVMMAPLMGVVALITIMDVGFPVLFWQQRPGLGAQPFKVFKFRTMAAAHDALGRRRHESQRVSAVGNVLRRTRVDELPQLISILTGDMSFVGPRPLLPVDQPADYSARLLVRPGLTGWAQIKGGRAISPADKAALDVWYVKNMSFMLDVKIMLGTVPMILFGEKIESDAIAQAWRELEKSRA
ncbi:sugar transferase [Bradyrhizobium commune]|uniref:Sugar transferase n=1 Tax=Bradyrhizobium commune TaxID=83627 RepID=A0A7S9H354_9BRAD|nr:sugar transferase [Bradyrhizobium commune]QPF94555.1 sugar transferase [Bradyrhizobium commune]